MDISVRERSDWYAGVRFGHEHVFGVLHSEAVLGVGLLRVHLLGHVGPGPGLAHPVPRGGVPVQYTVQYSTV